MFWVTLAVRMSSPGSKSTEEICDCTSVPDIIATPNMDRFRLSVETEHSRDVMRPFVRIILVDDKRIDPEIRAPSLGVVARQCLKNEFIQIHVNQTKDTIQGEWISEDFCAPRVRLCCYFDLEWIVPKT
jgi:hypothetical protein